MFYVRAATMPDTPAISVHLNAGGTKIVSPITRQAYAYVLCVLSVPILLSPVFPSQPRRLYLNASLFVISEPRCTPYTIIYLSSLQIESLTPRINPFYYPSYSEEFT